MKLYLFLAVIALVVNDIQAKIISSPSVDKLLYSDAVIWINSKDLTLAPNSREELLAKSATVLKGERFVEYRFLNDATVPISSHYYLIFLKKDHDKWHADTLGSIMGFDQDIPNIKHCLSTPLEFYNLLKSILVQEKSLDRAIFAAYLLQDAPPDFLKDSTTQILAWQRNLNNSSANLAALNLLVRCYGANAFKMISVDKLNLVSSHYDFDIQASLIMWIFTNASRENYLDLVKFASTQSGELAAETLVAVHKFASKETIPVVVDIFLSCPDLNVKYGCIQNLCVAFGKPVPNIEIFKANADKIIQYWASKLKEEAKQGLNYGTGANHRLQHIVVCAPNTEA